MVRAALSRIGVFLCLCLKLPVFVRGFFSSLLGFSFFSDSGRVNIDLYAYPSFLSHFCPFIISLFCLALIHTHPLSYSHGLAGACKGLEEADCSRRGGGKRASPGHAIPCPPEGRF